MENKAWIVNMLNENTAEILLYGFIGAYDVNASDFVKELRGLEQQYTKINVRINSGGGDVFEGLAMYNALKASKSEINTYIDGLAASMGTIIAMAGKKVYMSKAAMFMTHNASMYAGGNSDELKQGATILESIDRTMAAIYSTKTGKPVDDCLAAYLGSKDKWFTAEQAKSEGFVDELFDAISLEIPAAAKSEKEIWNIFHEQRFAAQFNFKNPNMKYNFSAATMQLLGFAPGAEQEQTAIEAKIAELHARAAKSDQYKTEKEAAEQKLNDELNKVAKEKVTSMLADAVKEKKITAELQTVFAEQYAGKPDELKKVLDTIKPVVSITDAINKANQSNAGGDDDLAAEYAKLDKAGKLDDLKAKNIEKFKSLYKAKWGTDYTG